MVCSGHSGGNGLPRKPSWCHSDGGDQSPERERMDEKRDEVERWRRRGKKKKGERGGKEEGVEQRDSRLIT